MALAKRAPMTLDRTFIGTWAPRAQALLRIVAGFVFLQHGTAKLFGFPHVAAYDGLPLVSLAGLAGVIETVTGALVLVGLFTRAAAFLASGTMAVAYFMAHAPQGHVLTPFINQGEPAVLYCFIFLFLAAAGAGAWSVDAGRGGGG